MRSSEPPRRAAGPVQKHNARNRGRTRNVFFPVGQGRWPDMRSIATRSQLRAYAQSFSAVEVETPGAAAAFRALRPAKNACRVWPGCSWASFSAASWRSCVVHERQQLLRGVRVALFDGGQDLRDIAHAVQLYPGRKRAGAGNRPPPVTPGSRVATEPRTINPPARPLPSLLVELEFFVGPLIFGRSVAGLFKREEIARQCAPDSTSASVSSRCAGSSCSWERPFFALPPPNHWMT